MNDWDQERIQTLVESGAEERHDLEFKAAGALGKSDGKKKTITIDVSAMANAAGGTMIFGMTEDRSHRAQSIDPIDPREFPKEWLDQVIHSIEPRIPELDIQPVRIDDGSGVVYVVEIPQSLTAHQALDGRYYRRYNFQQLPMRHHEIVDVMNRAKVPDLRLELDYQIVNSEANRHDYILKVKVGNNSTVTASHYKVEVTFPHPAFKPRADSVHAEWPHHTLAIRGLLSRREEGESITIIYRSQRPLYPKDTEDITDEITLRYQVDDEAFRIIGDRDPYIAWVVFADNSLPKKGCVKMRDLQQY